MNKADLIEKVAKDCDITKAVAEQVLNSILSTITDAVAAGDKVSLIGFGTFSVNDRAARPGPKSTNRSKHPDSCQKSRQVQGR